MNSRGPTKLGAVLFWNKLKTAQIENKIAGTGRVVPIIKEMKEDHGVCEKRCLFLLYKWEDQGLWEYGSCVGGGWLTDEAPTLDVKEVR